ncbi:zinc ribbon domain-containing protein [Primorskyibacter flagellatus]|uniref:Zinc-ribbon domain-containing protein n=1 Tax=Primorskyibacter flagellatus TaxID=1387277 RepID=A0A1W2ET56_9RHOB|nr:zinc ribbon domain-containing protein [Primorskyibacter flagellatus]SMD12841.1 hypothetical protein SAMN06295998_1434 [Primorskyibacter flagellatus]
MTLGSCPDCGHTVSLNAEACPNCGNPFQNRYEYSDERDSYNRFIVFFTVLIGCVVFYILASDLNLVTADKDRFDTVRMLNLMLTGQTEILLDGFYIDMKVILIQVKDAYYGITFGDAPFIDMPVLQNLVVAGFAFPLSIWIAGLAAQLTPRGNIFSMYFWLPVIFIGVGLLAYLTR